VVFEIMTFLGADHRRARPINRKARQNSNNLNLKT